VRSSPNVKPTDSQVGSQSNPCLIEQMAEYFEIGELRYMPLLLAGSNPALFTKVLLSF